MSSLWTPHGEHAPDPDQPGKPGPGPSAAIAPEEGAEPSEAEMREMLVELANTPVEAILLQVVVQLQELTLLHLSLARERPESLAQAQLALDAMGGVVEAAGDRFGPNAQPLAQALTSLRIAFVEVTGELSGEVSAEVPDLPADE